MFHVLPELRSEDGCGMKKKYYDGFIVHDILDAHLKPGKMLEVLKAFAEVKGVDAVEVIRCKDCGNWKPTETDEEIGECAILNKVVCFSCRTVANYYCAMAQPKDKKSETES